MIRRVLLSLGFIPVLILVIYIEWLHNIFFFLFVLALSVLSVRELGIILGKMRHDGSRIRWLFLCLPGSISILLYFLNSFFMERYLAILYITAYSTVIILATVSVSFWFGGFFKSFFLHVLVYIYTGVFCISLFEVRLSFGAVYVYFLFLLAWISDAGAYFIGTRFGKRKGIVRLSPNKSLEGYIASFLLTVAVAIGFKMMIPQKFPIGMKQTFSLGLMVAVLAPMGDLLESWVKRRGRVKDSSKFLPGFGGVLDIFDSILFTAPFYYVALYLF
ncbi:MAG: phosphatidate cytidylyltransferase [Spirochaetota bacterium]|nr:MAG: phosphatidate cytidylyltransferase [Spirochaetota bacterium]